MEIFTSITMIYFTLLILGYFMKIVVNDFNSSTWEAEEVYLCKFEDRLIYKVSSRTDKETLSLKSRKPKQNKTNKK